MIRSIDTVKAFVKIQNPFVTETLSTPGKDGNVLPTMKTHICLRPDDTRPEAAPPGQRQGKEVLCTTPGTCARVPQRQVGRQEGEEVEADRLESGGVVLPLRRWLDCPCGQSHTMQRSPENVSCGLATPSLSSCMHVLRDTRC